MRRPWKLEYFTRSRKETSFHPTRDAAMTALYGRLDLEQRDALAFNEQCQADYFGRLRGQMASSWRAVTRGRTLGSIVYNIACAKITRA